MVCPARMCRHSHPVLSHTHPRLMKLEKKMICSEVEALYTWSECMAISPSRDRPCHSGTAYLVATPAGAGNSVGPSSKTLPALTTGPNPASRRYVQHLSALVRADHPDEDFARNLCRCRYCGRVVELAARAMPAGRRLKNRICA